MYLRNQVCGSWGVYRWNHNTIENPHEKFQKSEIFLAKNFLRRNCHTDHLFQPIASRRYPGYGIQTALRTRDTVSVSVTLGRNNKKNIGAKAQRRQGQAQKHIKTKILYFQIFKSKLAALENAFQLVYHTPEIQLQ